MHPPLQQHLVNSSLANLLRGRQRDWTISCLAETLRDLEFVALR